MAAVGRQKMEEAELNSSLRGWSYTAEAGPQRRFVCLRCYIY